MPVAKFPGDGASGGTQDLHVLGGGCHGGPDMGDKNLVQ
jgi:hypothetical protein